MVKELKDKQCPKCKRGEVHIEETRRKGEKKATIYIVCNKCEYVQALE